MVTKEQIDRLRSLLRTGADAEFFFSSVKTPIWLPALLEAGYFASPPPPITGDGWIQYPRWPQSGYLARVAAQDPEMAIKIALQIGETDNAAVNDDLLQVAMAVPPPLAAKLLPRLGRWITDSSWRWRGKDFAAFIARAAQGGAVADALNLVRKLVAFSPDPEKAEKIKLHEQAEFGWGLEPRSRLEQHDYQQVLQGTAPILAAQQPLETLRMLAQTLDGYIRELLHSGAPNEHDGSIFWRPSISDHGQNSPYKQITYLVSALRQTAESAIGSGRLGFAEVTALLLEFKWDVFRRLELHLVRHFRDAAGKELVRRLALNEEYFVGPRWDLEYGLLLRESFTQLDGAAQGRILSWIEAGPKPGEIEAMRERAGERTDREDLVQGWIIRWRILKLYWLKDSLPPVWRQRYDTWVATYGEPEHPGFHVWIGSVETGSESPVTTEIFRGLSIDEQIQFLRTWEPSSPGWRGPSKEGLAGLLHVEAKTSPEKYFAAAEAFAGVEAIYLNELIRGLAEGLKGKMVADWSSFWTLVHWIVQQPDPETDLKDDFTGKVRPGRKWRGARLALARFIDDALQNVTAAIPFAERENVWSVISVLARDPNPTVEEDGRSLTGIMEPLTLSLNCIRGEAFHAIFSYISWVRAAVASAVPDLSDVPEARELLDEHLDAAKEPALAVHSVYATHVNYLAAVAPSWLRENRLRIFPDDGARLQVAWNTFILSSQPNAAVLKILEGEFARAIQTMRKPGKADQNHDPRVSLGQHLMVNYWWGHLDFEKAGDLVAAFFRKAPEDVRAQALEFVGRSFGQAAGPVPTEFLARMVRLWEWRVATANAAGAKGFARELAAFGWWFDSDKFETQWAIGQMLRVLEVIRPLENQFLWMQRFGALAEQHVADAVRALEITLEIVHEKSGTFWEDDEAEKILRAAAKTNDLQIMAKARRAQSALLRMGKKQFLASLPPAAGAT